MTERTKKCRTANIIFAILHFLCVFAPIIGFVIYGYVTGETVEKVCLSMTVVAGILLGVISFITSSSASKNGLNRIVVWVLIIGIMFCLEDLRVFIFIMAATSILDEAVIVKLKDRYEELYRTNKEIDKRL